MNIDWFTVLAQVINFLVFVALLKRFLYNPIITAMDQREAKITSRLEEAVEKGRNAEHQAEAYQQKLLELAEQREGMLSQARGEADVLRKDLINKARDEAGISQAKWVEAILQQKNAFLMDFRQRAGKQVCAIARQALTDLANADLNQAVVGGFLQRLRTLDQGERDQMAGSIRDSRDGALLRSAFEIDPGVRQRITQIIQAELAEGIEVRFETAPELICGIELKASGRQIAWNLDDYLEALEENLVRALDEEAQARIQDKGQTEDK